MTNESKTRRVTGSCHCGKVRYETEADLTTGFRCNCTACTKLAPTVAVVAPNAFRLLAGETDLHTYEFGARNLSRRFCNHCGVLCFARGRDQDGNEFIGVNLNTLDHVELVDLPVVYFDGRHDTYEPRPTPYPIGESLPPR